MLQSCPTLCDPLDCNLSGSSVYGILQARILEQVAVPSSRGSSRPRDRILFKLRIVFFFFFLIYVILVPTLAKNGWFHSNNYTLYSTFHTSRVNFVLALTFCRYLVREGYSLPLKRINYDYSTDFFCKGSDIHVL